MVKRRDSDHVGCGLDECKRTSVLRIESPSDGIKTGVGKLPWEEHGGNLLTGHAVSGVEEA